MRWRTVASVLVALLSTAACTVGGPAAVTAEEDTTSATPPTSDGLIAHGCEPGSIVPPSVTESCGERVAELLFTGLVEHDPETGRARWGPFADRAMAQLITSPDGRRWRIELQPGWEFHDGEPVTARSFADAWNHTAYGPNARANAFLFSRIAGFEQVRCTNPGCDPPPDEDELRGIEVEDEHTLLVTLSQPDRLFPAVLGHIAFSPLPAVAFEDPEAFEVAPIGNGPFQMDGVWEHEVAIRLARAEEYAGTPSGVDRIEFRLLEPGAAYRRFLDGELDVLQDLPPAVRDEFPREPGGQLVEQAGDHYTFLVAPVYARAVADRRFLTALSLALDRRGLIEQQLGGAGTPADSLVAPVVPVAGGDDPCGGYCDFDPAAARRLLDETGGWPEAGVRLWFHDTRDGRRLASALADQWRGAFGLDPADVRLHALPLNEFVAHLEDRQAPGLQLLSWVMDYPSPRNYLEPLHGRGGLFNFDGYGDVQVSTWLQLAAQAQSENESYELYRRAEEAILDDRHHIPLWFATHQALHSTRVSDVTLDPSGRVRLEDVTVSEADS